MNMKGLCRSLVLGFGAVALAWPAGLSIGVVTTIGGFQSATGPEGVTEISDGARVQTTVAPTRVLLGNGVNVLMATRSDSRVYSDRLVLQDGAVRLTHLDDSYHVQVRNLTVDADRPGVAAVVRAEGKTVEVASLGGSLRVTDGVRLVRVASGTKVSFQNQGQTQTGASPSPTSTTEADRNALLWSIVAISGAAIAFGSIAAAEGKSPF